MISISWRRGRPGLKAWWLLALFLGIGMCIVVFAGRSLVGGVVMGASFLLGAVLRVVLPEERAGGLAVRSKTVDAATLVVLGLTVLLAFISVDLRPRG